MADLVKGTDGIHFQGFAASRGVEITAEGEWTPEPGDRAFVCSDLQGIKINGGVEFKWQEGIPMVIRRNQKYTFSVTSTIAVM